MSDTAMQTASKEALEEFRARVRAWMVDHLPPAGDTSLSDRDLQRIIFDAGFAGLAFPSEYGGAGLTLDHHKAFYDVASELDRQVPTTLMVSIGMLGPTILDCGSPAAKARFLPPLLRGDELWMQLLSEPRGGSDMAGSITRLTRDGDTFVLNGTKMWSSEAHNADFGLALCRSDWDVPKHRGLSMIAVPLQGTPGLTINRIRGAGGELKEYCEEFFDDVSLPAENLIGELNHGWAVAQRLLFHERNATGNIGYGYLADRRKYRPTSFTPQSPEMIARTAASRGVGAACSSAIAESFIESVVVPLTSARMMRGMQVGTHKGQWGSLSKLQSSNYSHRSVRTALIAAGASGVMWDGDEIETDNPGTVWLESRGITIAGGSSEMQRNIISERLLGLPREPDPSREMPFSEMLRTLKER